MPEYILGELCERLPGVVVAGDLVTAERRQRPEDVLETTELTLLRALTDAGGEAGRHELERACREAGMKLSSFNNRIAYSPIVVDLGKGRFGLRGYVEAMDPQRPGGLWRAAGPAAASDDELPRPGDLAAYRQPRRR